MVFEHPSVELTLLTASWNRAHLLPRLHRSIVANLPTEARIEWLVVDDGSTDNTTACVEEFAAISNFPVRYHRIPRGGKHRALNVGFTYAAGHWLFIIDSDDWFLKDGLDAVLREIEKAELLRSDGMFIPMNVAKRDTQYTFTNPGRSVKFIDRVNEDRWFDSSFVFSKSICNARFPEVKNEAFLSEGAFLFDLDPSLTFYLSDAVCVGVEYQPDGLSLDHLRIRTSAPRGATLAYDRMLAKPLRLRLKLRTLVNYGRFWWHCAIQKSRPYGTINVTRLAVLPISFVLMLWDLWRLWKMRSEQGEGTI